MGACFSPQQNCQAQLIKTIGVAKQSIFVQSFIFTSAKLAAALESQRAKGLDVEVIVDKHQTDCRHFTQLDRLLKHHVLAWVDANMQYNHNEVIVIDNKFVVIGSYAFASWPLDASSSFVAVSDADVVNAFLKNWRITKKRSLKISALACRASSL